jgi:hypothetical protein
VKCHIRYNKSQCEEVKREIFEIVLILIKMVLIAAVLVGVISVVAFVAGVVSGSEQIKNRWRKKTDGLSQILDEDHRCYGNIRLNTDGTRV